MDRYERLLKLHRMLKVARLPVSLARLQDELECSRATVYRDVAFLRDGLGAPIESGGDDGSAFFYNIDGAEKFELPGLWLSSSELESLLAMHQLLARTGGAVLSGAARHAPTARSPGREDQPRAGSDDRASRRENANVRTNPPVCRREKFPPHRAQPQAIGQNARRQRDRWACSENDVPGPPARAWSAPHHRCCSR